MTRDEPLKDVYWRLVTSWQPAQPTRGARAGGLGLVVSWLPPSPAYNQPPQLAPIPNNPQLAPSRLRGASWQPAQKMRGPRRCERASWQLVATRTSWQLDPPASSQLAPPPQLAARWLELLCGVAALGTPF